MTAFIEVVGCVDVRHVSSPQNVRALAFMRDAIARDGISLAVARAGRSLTSTTLT